MQLALLVNAPLLDAVPALLLSNAQSARDVIPKVEPLLLGQAVGWRSGDFRSHSGQSALLALGAPPLGSLLAHLAADWR